MLRILVMHGPNLNALGTREPEHYGSQTLDALARRLDDLAKDLGCALEHLQSNHEGVLIDALYGAAGRVDGVLLNPAGLTHTSVALGDAVLAARVPVVEVHLTNPGAREVFRRRSRITAGVLGVVQGFGIGSYLLALRGLVEHLSHGAQA